MGAHGVTKIKATNGGEDMFKCMLMSSESGRFCLVYVNEGGVREGGGHLFTTQ